MEEKFENLQGVLYDRIIDEIRKGAFFAVGSESRSSNAKDIKTLMEAFCQNDKRVQDAVNKEADQEIEKNKIDTNLVIEKLRSEIDWKHFVLEAAKIGVPLLIAVGQWALFRESRDIAGKFEENHIYTTDIGRKTSLPIGIFKWK